MIDLSFAEAKLKALEEEADKIRDTHPEEAQVVMDRTAKLRKEWEELNAMLHEREAKLEAAADGLPCNPDEDGRCKWIQNPIMVDDRGFSSDNPNSTKEQRLRQTKFNFRQLNGKWQLAKVYDIKACVIYANRIYVLLPNKCDNIIDMNAVLFGDTCVIAAWYTDVKGDTDFVLNIVFPQGDLWR